MNIFGRFIYLLRSRTSLATQEHPFELRVHRYDALASDHEFLYAPLLVLNSPLHPFENTSRDLRTLCLDISAMYWF